MSYTTNRRTFLGSAAAVCGVRDSAAQLPPRAGNPQSDGDFGIAQPGEYNIREEDHYGVINGHITVGVNFKDVGGIGGMYAPPYASTDFLVEVRIDGRPVPTAEYSWTPIEVRRKGRTGDIEVASETFLLHGQRSGMLRLTITNRGRRAASIPLQFNIVGSF